MLENDPVYKSNNQSRGLVGSSQGVGEQYDGITWGISDEREVYAYKSES